jgi:hypothetical protein
VQSELTPSGVRATRVWVVWGDLLGDGYCIKLVPVRRFLTRSVAVFLVAYATMIVSIFALNNSPLQIPVLVLLGLPPFVTLGVALLRLDAFGKSLAHDLAEAGFTTDRPAPMRNTYLFERWRARNGIPSHEIARVGNQGEPSLRP